jgi:dienelactone hydrolase
MFLSFITFIIIAKPIQFCWGGKVVSLTSGAGTLYSAGAQSSPAMVDPADAEKITSPSLMLASKDEPAEDVKKWEAALKVPKHVETVDQIHGYMTARANLEDETNKAEYERGYKTLLEFYAKHL